MREKMIPSEKVKKRDRSHEIQSRSAYHSMAEKTSGAKEKVRYNYYYN